MKDEGRTYVFFQTPSLINPQSMLLKVKCPALNPLNNTILKFYDLKKKSNILIFILFFIESLSRCLIIL